MSLDGFIAGVNDSPEVPLGDGIRLFEKIGLEQIKLERLRVIESNDATHILFQVNK